MKELSIVFSKYTLEHLKEGKNQGVDSNKKGPFLVACEKFLAGEITEDELHSVTEKKAFGDVIERFHTVNRADVPTKFYDHSAFKAEKKIILTDDIFKILQSYHGDSFIHEIEARWKLVEMAWSENINPMLLDVDFDEETKIFFIRKNDRGKQRRVDVTSSRDALNGYQKGHCFFCFDYISVEPGNEKLCQVDHFFPHTLFDRIQNNINYNGVWNLVLACKKCNGAGGKGAKVPSLKLLERLHKRNNFYVESHLPLKESILKTGINELDRRAFLQHRYDEAHKTLISADWEPEQVLEPKF